MKPLNSYGYAIMERRLPLANRPAVEQPPEDPWYDNDPRGTDPRCHVNPQQFVNHQEQMNVTNQTQNNVTYVSDGAHELRDEVERYATAKVLEMRQSLLDAGAERDAKTVELVTGLNEDVKNQFAAQHGQLAGLVTNVDQRLTNLSQAFDESREETARRLTLCETVKEGHDAVCREVHGIQGALEEGKRHRDREQRRFKDMDKTIGWMREQHGKGESRMDSCKEELANAQQRWGEIQRDAALFAQRLSSLENRFTEAKDDEAKRVKDYFDSAMESFPLHPTTNVQAYPTMVQEGQPNILLATDPLSPSRREDDEMVSIASRNSVNSQPSGEPNRGNARPGGGPPDGGGGPSGGPGGHGPLGGGAPFAPLPFNGLDLSKLRIPCPAPYTGQGDMSVEEWIIDMKRWLRCHNVVETNWLEVMMVRLEGRAKRWLNARELAARNGQQAMPYTWQDLAEELRIQFEPITTTEAARRKLRELRQTSTIQAYIDQFQDLIFRIPEMREEDKYSNFVGGLRDWLRHQVDAHGGGTLDGAMRMAQRLSRDQASDYRSSNYNRSNRPMSGNHQSSQANQPYRSYRPFGWQPRGNRPFGRGRGGGRFPPRVSMIQPPNQGVTKKSQGSNNRQRGTCYICNGNHMMRDCPHLEKFRKSLN